MHQNILGAYTFIQIQLKYHWGHYWVGPFDMGPYHMGPFTIGPFSIRAFFCGAFAHIPRRKVVKKEQDYVHQVFKPLMILHSSKVYFTLGKLRFEDPQPIRLIVAATNFPAV